MAKSKVITLEEAIELKQTIQDLLTSKRHIFKNENCVVAGSERNFDLKKILKDIEKLSGFFVTLKLEIQQGNLNILKGEDRSIQSYVYELSEIKNDILTFKSALKAPHWKNGVLVIDKEELLFKPQYDEKQVEDLLANLNKRYYFIETELSRLNKLVEVTIPFDPKDLT